MSVSSHSPAPRDDIDSRRRLCYAFMKLARQLDTRFESLLLSGRVSKWYSGVGNEATTVSAGLILEPGDMLCTLHRDLGAILSVYLDAARTFPDAGFEHLGRGSQEAALRPHPRPLLKRLARQLMGKADSFTDGIERSFHYSYLAPEHGLLHLGMISHLGAMIPVAAGCAFAMRQSGTDRVALNFIGDGGTSTGDFHEGLNLAAVWKLPLVLVIENNRYAFSTPNRLQYAAGKLADRGLGYGIPAQQIDGNDPEEVTAAVSQAVERARAGHGPSLIEAMLGRMRGHAEGDGSLAVVPEDEQQTYRSADPLPAYAHFLEERSILDRSTREHLDERVEELVEEALAAAMEAADPDPQTAQRPIFAPQTPRQKAAPTILVPTAESKEVTYIEAIHDALLQEMERDPRVVLMGQDIGAFQGAFRATRGLYTRWPERVLDTPICESATLGVAAGAAVMGLRPVVEMQFADFVSSGFNQLVNVIAKLYYRQQIPCPLVVRLPSGGGVGGGPFHSQNPEGWFCHVAGLKVVCPATARDAKGLLAAALRDPNPVLFFEHKYLYRRIKEDLPAGELEGELGRAEVRRPGNDLSLIAYGASMWLCLEAAEELQREGVEAEVVDLRTLIPFDEATVLASVKKTGRALVVHEAPRTLGFGAEVVSRLADQAFPWLDAPLRRVAHADRPVPYARVLENQLLPTKDKILREARQLLEY